MHIDSFIAVQPSLLSTEARICNSIELASSHSGPLAGAIADHFDTLQVNLSLGAMLGHGLVGMCRHGRHGAHW